MKKLTRRGFLRLASIWGVVPLLPKGLLPEMDLPEEELKENETPEEKPSLWDEDAPGPYFCDGGCRNPDYPVVVWVPWENNDE